MGKISEALDKASALQLKQPERQKEDIPESDLSPKRTRDNSSLSPLSLKLPAGGYSVGVRHHPESVDKWETRFRLAITPSSPIAESFRKLRTTILHPDKGDPPRTILITSAVPNEGKGFVTANLGVSIAQSTEYKCMMVGCDLRRPGLASLFGVNATAKGLVNYLRGETHWSDVVLSTAQDNLSLLPCGPSPDNPTELIDSARMKKFIEELSENHNELFLFDSPPLHAAAETSVLAKMVDKVLVVVRWGTPGREQVTNLIDTIGREKIIGIIFNAFEQNALDGIFEKKGYYGYYGYYGKGY